MSFAIPPLPSGMFPPEFQAWWQQVRDAIEGQDATQSSALEDIERALSDAGIALVAAQQRMPALPAWPVATDVTGTILAGQLPRNVQFRRFEGGDDVTLDSEWSFTTESGSIDAEMGLATGLLTINDVDASSVLQVMSIRNDVPLSVMFQVEQVVSASTSTINSTSMAAIAPEITVKSGTTGRVDLGAALQVLTDDADPAGEFPVYGIWKWYNSGTASWDDVGSETASQVDARISEAADGENYVLQRGSLTIPGTKTGLTASTDYRFRPYARNNSGARTMAFHGTLSGVGS